MDLLTVTLSMCIGCAVAWSIALYTERGFRWLIWDTFAAMVGAALCALALVWLAPRFVIVGLVIAGPVCAYLMIAAGRSVRERAFRGARGGTEG